MAKVRLIITGNHMPHTNCIVEESTALKALDQYAGGRDVIVVRDGDTTVGFRSSDITMLGFRPYDEAAEKAALEAQMAQKAKYAETSDSVTAIGGSFGGLLGRW